jgi:LPPG:FO 2-phospho-L-lactate transferase
MILALSGGVGGAKLAHGLASLLEPEELMVIVNTGDDFQHLGLHISPDIDTMTYTLAGLNDVSRGWGLAGESWQFMDALRSLGGDDWFSLGDRDLATHVTRTMRLRQREALSSITADLAARLGVRHRIVPMSDDPVASVVVTDEGELPFQDYFVRLGCAPRFHSLRLAGIENAWPSPDFLAALDDPALTAIIICPSNPLLSIEPILRLPGVMARLRARRVPLVAISPFIGGNAVKGPAAKIMRELGIAPTPGAVATLYDGLLDGLVIDNSDAEAPRPPGVAVLTTDTLMRNPGEQRRLARETLDFAQGLA